MSEFWVASDLPCDDLTIRQGRILTAWCEAEVERACRESWEHISVIDGKIGEDGELPINVFLQSDWDGEIGSLSTVTQLIGDAAEAHAAFGTGLIADAADRARIEKMLRRIEAVIAQVRERYPNEAAT